MIHTTCDYWWLLSGLASSLGSGAASAAATAGIGSALGGMMGGGQKQQQGEKKGIGFSDLMTPGAEQKHGQGQSLMGLMGQNNPNIAQINSLFKTPNDPREMMPNRGLDLMSLLMQNQSQGIV